jgi:hypothetical protein
MKHPHAGLRVLPRSTASRVSSQTIGLIRLAVGASVIGRGWFRVSRPARLPQPGAVFRQDVVDQRLVADVHHLGGFLEPQQNLRIHPDRNHFPFLDRRQAWTPDAAHRRQLGIS